MLTNKILCGFFLITLFSFGCSKNSPEQIRIKTKIDSLNILSDTNKIHISNLVVKKKINKQPTTVLDTFYIKGITIKSNPDEASFDKDIADLWQFYTDEYLTKQIMIDKNPFVYVLYHNFKITPKPQMHITIGIKCFRNEEINKGQSMIIIPKTKYVVTEINTKNVNQINTFWKNIESENISRNSVAEFELYKFDENFQIESLRIFISSN